MPAPAEPGPPDPSVLYHVYPLGCLGADQIGADRVCRRPLRELVDWLGHLRSLGADTLLLGPVFASLSHGYDTVDHRRVDPRLGDDSDLDTLVAAAADQGVGVVLDGAFAYASREFHRLADPDEDRAPWFRRDADGGLVPWRVDSLVTPDHTADGYRTYVAQTLTHWLDRGVAGWRLDSAWSAPDAFWRRVLARVRETHPRAWFLGQVFDDDLPAVVNSTTVSAATEYALMHGARGWLSGGPVEDIAATLRVHARNAAGRTVPHTFLGNHDFARLADVVPAAARPVAFALLMTLPGRPAIYYGDEIGLTSTWTEGGSDALLRPPLTLADVSGPTGEAAGLLDAVRTIGALRRENPWLGRAELVDVNIDGGVLSYTVTGPDRELRVRLDPLGRAGAFPPGWQVDPA